MQEKENVDILVDAIGQHWDVWREVEGMSLLSGKNKRIDLIIRSKEYVNGERLVFGVECKRPVLNSFNDYSKWFKQSVVYTQCMWGERGVTLPILVYPKPFPHDDPAKAYVFTRLLGQFGIGFIDSVQYKSGENAGKTNWRIELSDSPIWSSFYGFNKSMSKINFQKLLDL